MQYIFIFPLFITIINLDFLMMKVILISGPFIKLPQSRRHRGVYKITANVPGKINTTNKSQFLSDNEVISNNIKSPVSSNYRNHYDPVHFLSVDYIRIAITNITKNLTR